MCAVAAVTVAGSSLAQVGGVGWAAAGAVGIGLWVTRRLALLAMLAIAMMAGAGAAARAISLPQSAAGLIATEATVLSDPAPLRRGWGFVVAPSRGEASGAALAVAIDSHPDIAVGDTVELTGRLSVRTARLHRIPVAGWVTARALDLVENAGGVMAAANTMRSRVHQLFPATQPGSALMRGFLIGDTAAVAPSALDEMRRAGLLHFVAVSGGNVAVFLGAIWLILGLVPLGPRWRAAVGLAAVGLFVLITRWEPSVVRAGLMVGLLLAGRVAGIPVSGWASLGATVTLLAVVAPQLVFDIGFQLSAVATSGLLVGSGAWADRRPAMLWRSVAATLAAQLAVMPLLLAAFGTVPAFAVVANVAGAPLVAGATWLGWAASFTGLSVLAEAAAIPADLVGRLARWAAHLPQVGLGGVVAMVVWFAVLRRKPALAWSAVAVAIVVVTAPTGPPAEVEIVFLDVGQGDAVLLRSPHGEVIAVDTGPDPVSYAAALRRYGVRRLDLLILTHTDGDHVGGLGALRGRVSVGEIWHPRFTDPEQWDALLDGVGNSARAVAAGFAADVGPFRFDVLSPGRRFASDNDGSLVLWVEAAHATLLLAGDAERVAQGELPPLRPDVLLVPHHGSSTTDLRWLRAAAGPFAVLSYGADNSFGHPAPEIMEVLRQVGAQIRFTVDGDVVIHPADWAVGG